MPPNNLESPTVHLNAGSAKVESTLYEPMAIIDDTMEANLSTSIQTNDPSPASATPTVGSALTSKRTISSVKSSRSTKRTRTTRSSRTSGQASTSSERDCYGWWTKSCEELSRRLWFPTEIASAGLPLNSLSTYVEEQTPVSWSKIKKYTQLNPSSQKTLWPLFTSSLVATTACGATAKKRPAPKKVQRQRTKKSKQTSKKIEETKAKNKAKTQAQKHVVRCQKVRLLPTPDQALILRKWIKGARDTYNRALRLVNDGKAKPNTLLKKLVVTERQEDNLRVKQMKETPAKIRSRAILDLIDAFKTATAGYKARLVKLKATKNRWRVKKKEEIKGRRRWKTRKAFKVKFKSRRLTEDSFGFESNNAKVKDQRLHLFSRLKKNGMPGGIRMSENLKCPIEMCPRVQYTFGRWYLLCPYKTPQVQETPSEKLVFLDPGVRTFQTYYSENEAGQIGFDMEGKLDRVKAKIKGIKARLQWAKENKLPKKEKRLRRAWYRANARASNVVDDLHWKTIKFLLDNFDFILAPRLNVSGILRDCKLPVIVKERMTILHHGRFSDRLKMKAQTRGKTVETDFEEHGTSRTCSRCGKANHGLGSSEVFWCDECGFSGHRDVNAAKNHCLKRLIGKQKY